MIVFKYFCFVIAFFCTCMYISNIITDIASSISWKESLHFGKDEEDNNKIAIQNANFRLIISIIMALAWGVVVIL